MNEELPEASAPRQLTARGERQIIKLAETLQADPAVRRRIRRHNVLKNSGIAAGIVVVALGSNVFGSWRTGKRVQSTLKPIVDQAQPFFTNATKKFEIIDGAISDFSGVASNANSAADEVHAMVTAAKPFLPGLDLGPAKVSIADASRELKTIRKDATYFFVGRVIGAQISDDGKSYTITLLKEVDIRIPVGVASTEPSGVSFKVSAADAENFELHSLRLFTVIPSSAHKANTQDPVDSKFTVTDGKFKGWSINELLALAKQDLTPAVTTPTVALGLDLRKIADGTKPAG